MGHMEPPTPAAAGVEQVADFGKAEGHRIIGLDGDAQDPARIPGHPRGDIEAQHRFSAAVDLLDDVPIAPRYRAVQPGAEDAVDDGVAALEVAVREPFFAEGSNAQPEA